MDRKESLNTQLSESALKELEEEALRHLAAGASCCVHSKDGGTEDQTIEFPEFL